MLRRLAVHLPPHVVARLNRAQFRYPLLRRPLQTLAARVARGEGAIARGPGKGLRIDPTGKNSGYLLGTTEPEEQAWLADHIRPGDTVYDIGANIGFHTLLAARLVTPAGKVYAFEPLPANLEGLRKNVALNSFEHVAIVPAAVAAAEGRASLRDADGTGMRSAIVRTPGNEPVIDVLAITIDTWVKRVDAQPPTLMKIDVEGGELDVLAGAMETIARWRPAMLIEVHWLGAELARFAEEHLAPLGYVVRTLDGSEIPTEPVRFHAIAEASPS